MNEIEINYLALDLHKEMQKCVNLARNQGFLSGKTETIKDEIKWLESIQENLLVGKRKKGQHKYNKISVQEKLKELTKKLEEIK